MYFSGKISYTGESETGEQVSVTEVVLVKDESYTGAEAALYTYCEENGISDFSLDITKKKINNLLCTDVFPYYEFKVAMMSESASGKPKKLTDIVIVGAEDFQKAFDKVKVDYKNYLIPAEVESGKLTTFTSYVETAQEEVEEESDSDQAMREQEDEFVGNSWPGVLFPDGSTGNSGPNDIGAAGVQGPIGQRMTVIREDIDVASGRTVNTYSQDIPETEVTKE